MIKITLLMGHCHKIVTGARIDLNPDCSKKSPVSIFKK